VGLQVLGGLQATSAGRWAGGFWVGCSAGYLHFVLCIRHRWAGLCWAAGGLPPGGYVWAAGADSQVICSQRLGGWAGAWVFRQTLHLHLPSLEQTSLSTCCCIFVCIFLPPALRARPRFLGTACQIGGFLFLRCVLGGASSQVHSGRWAGALVGSPQPQVLDLVGPLPCTLCLCLLLLPLPLPSSPDRCTLGTGTWAACSLFGQVGLGGLQVGSL
jgi:hypothetical protein